MVGWGKNGYKVIWEGNNCHRGLWAGKISDMATPRGHIGYLETKFKSTMLKSLNKIVRVSSRHKFESTLVIRSIYPSYK